MTLRRWKLAGLVCVSLLFLAAGQANAAPTISSLSPTSGAVGASVTIAGSSFGSTQGSSTVKFNGTTATITSWGASSIVAKVPTGATTGNVVVTVSGVASNGKSFTVLPTPSITSLSPTSGAVGASATIAGANFGSTQGTSTVKFNGTTATVTSWSASSIVATVPSGATTGNVVVNASGVNTNGISFTVLTAPSITSLTPTSGAVGASVTIAGSNFGANHGSSTVKFNGTSATVTTWSATSIVATVPTGATTGNVVVHAIGVDSAGKAFTVVAAPSITSLSPTSGAVGASVTITGSNFGSTQGTSTVKFNGTTATITSWAAGGIVTKVPTGATTGNVVLHASGVDSNGSSFTVLPTPSITTLSPTSGAVGAQVTITGTNFGSTQGTSTAKFNGTTAAITSWSATSIVATVPTGATTGNVVVTVSAVASNGVSFTVVAAPSITSLAPTSATVGTSVTITGTNFGSSQGSGTVKFNGTLGTPSSWTATSIKVPVPSGATTGNVVVHASGVDSNGVNFTVLLTPSITSLSPNFGPTGAVITIAGTNFGSTQGSSTVKFIGTAATPCGTCWSATSISVAVPNGATTGNVVVTVSGVASSGVSFTVLPTPSITSLSPTSGGVGASITIGGTNFGTSQGSSTVTFNGVAAAPCGTCWSATSITAPVPSGATTGNVVVTVSGVPSNGMSFTVAALTRVAVSIPGTPITPGATQQFTATGVYSDLSSQDITTSVTWTSSLPSVATINSAGLATAVAYGQTTIQASLGGFSQSVTLAVEASNFVATGNLNSGRTLHSATVLSDGTVFMAGGTSSGVGALSSAERYNQSTRVFTATGNLTVPRSQHTATLLNNGTVLIVGGESTTGTSAELYNPSTGTFTATGSMSVVRNYGHTATLLQNGMVLVVGGAANGATTAELYNPTTGTFTQTGSMSVALHYHTATLLNNGKVLIIGGADTPTSIFTSNTIYSSAQLYDPATGQFTTSGSMSVSRIDHTATLLASGLVLVTGGQADISGYSPLSSAELYDPSTGAFTLTGSLTTGRTQHTATLLSDGVVLIAGGPNNPSPTAELFYPTTGTFAPTGPMVTVPPYSHTASLLPSGMVLIAGGSYGTIYAELYQPTSFTTPPALISLAVYPLNQSIVVGTSYPFSANGVFADGTAQDMTNKVSWGSSVPTVATISAAGLATGASAGATTITASSGSISASTALSVTSVQLVSITITPQNSVILVGATQQFTATGNYNDNSTRNLTSSVTWSSSVLSVATINASGLATGVGLGSTLIQATLGSVQGSTWFSAEPVLQSLSLTPSSGQIAIGGTLQLQAIGNYSSGSTSVTGLSGWTTSNANVATVTGGLVRGVSSGSATITATYNYFSSSFSNTAVITVTNQYAAPQISSSIFPTPTFAGWTHQNTTVTFTCTPGGLPIASCTSPVTVTTEGTNQVITGTVTDTAGTSVSTSVTLYIDKTRPALTVTSPADGTTFSSSSVTITGSISDNLSGVASIDCNGAQASISAGNFSCNIGLGVGVNVVRVAAFDYAGNVSAVLLHEFLTGTLPVPNSLQVTPAGVNMLAGGFKTFTAVDDTGRPRPDATWTVDNPSLARITTGSFPTLRALAAGTVSLTSTVQGVSAQTQVVISTLVSFPPGIATWAAPPVPGFSAGEILEAMPSTFGPDLYALQKSSAGKQALIQAFTGDGQQTWQTTLYSALAGNGVPDGFGGLVVMEACDSADPLNNPLTIVDLDGATGAVLWQSSLAQVTGNLGVCLSGLPKFAIRQDGAVVIAMPLQISPAMVVLDGATGQVIMTPSITPSTFTSAGGQSSSCDCFTPVGQPIVDSDGSVYVEYFVQNDLQFYPTRGVLWLLKMAPDGSTSTTQLSSYDAGHLWPGQIIPDGQGGVLATWAIDNTFPPGAYHPYQAAHVSSGVASAPFDMPMAPQNMLRDSNTGIPLELPLVLGENGSVLASYGSSAVSMQPGSGSLNWDYQLPQGLTSAWASEGGGFILVDGQSNQIPLDGSGSAGSSVACPGGVSPLALGNWAVSGVSPISVVTCSKLETGSSPWPTDKGAGNSSAPKLNVVSFIPRSPGLPTDPTFGSPQLAASYLVKQVPSKVAGNKVYIDTGKLVADIPSFITSNGPGKPQIDVMGFIGDSDLINCATANNLYCRFSDGMIFVDNYLIRTPNCDALALGLCYYLDTTGPSHLASGNPPSCGANEYAVTITTNGVPTTTCYLVIPYVHDGEQTPRCNNAQIGSYCFLLPTGNNGLAAELRSVLLTSAKVVFVASCRTTDVFTGWWDLNLNAAPGGRALVVPDIDAMAQLATNAQNVAPQNQGYVDLVQGMIGYQAFLNSLAAGNNAEIAKNDANTAINNFYSLLLYNGRDILPQVIYKVVGNNNVCPNCRVVP